MLTEIGLAILGYALLGSDLPMWIGWMFIGSMVLSFVLTLTYRDMVPLMFYLVTPIAGIALLALGTRQRLGRREVPQSDRLPGHPKG
jgi:hypothetical protein